MGVRCVRRREGGLLAAIAVAVISACAFPATGVASGGDVASLSAARCPKGAVSVHVRVPGRRPVDAGCLRIAGMATAAGASAGRRVGDAVDALLPVPLRRRLTGLAPARAALWRKVARAAAREALRRTHDGELHGVDASATARGVTVGVSSALTSDLPECPDAAGVGVGPGRSTLRIVARTSTGGLEQDTRIGSEIRLRMSLDEDAGPGPATADIRTTVGTRVVLDGEVTSASLEMSFRVRFGNGVLDVVNATDVLVRSPRPIPAETVTQIMGLAAGLGVAEARAVRGDVAYDWARPNHCLTATAAHSPGGAVWPGRPAEVSVRVTDRAGSPATVTIDAWTTAGSVTPRQVRAVAPAAGRFSVRLDGAARSRVTYRAAGRRGVAQLTVDHAAPRGYAIDWAGPFTSTEYDHGDYVGRSTTRYRARICGPDPAAAAGWDWWVTGDYEGIPTPEQAGSHPIAVSFETPVSIRFTGDRAGHGGYWFWEVAAQLVAEPQPSLSLIAENQLDLYAPWPGETHVVTGAVVAPIREDLTCPVLP